MYVGAHTYYAMFIKCSETEVKGSRVHTQLVVPLGLPGKPLMIESQNISFSTCYELACAILIVSS